MNIDYSLGITVFMPNCSFEAEISRREIVDSITQMDRTLTEAGVDTDNTVRISSIMQNIVDISFQLANGDVEQEDGVSKIALGFVYVFAKRQNISEIEKIRGLIGCLADDKLYLNPCNTAEEYAKAGKIMRSSAKKLLDNDGEMVDCTPAKPTMH